MTMDEEERLKAKNDAGIERSAASAGGQTAATAATKRTEKRKENPEFFQQLQDLGLDTDEYSWITQRLGPLTADAHLIANRSESYERETKWIDMNRGERIIAEREPGRLCRGNILEIAQRVHNRGDKTAVQPNTVDERRVIRDAMEGVTNFKTLGIETAGLSSVTQATSVQKTERMESEQSKTESAARFLG